MKKLIFLSILNIVFVNIIFSQGIAINNNGNVADNSAMLDVSSTSQGMLIPRISNTERNAIPSPAVGLLIYNTTTNTFNFYKSSGWHELLGNFVSVTSGILSPGGGSSVNMTGAVAHNSAMLDVSSDSTGMLFPRTTSASVISPATGLIIFDNSTNNLKYFNGSVWKIACENFITVTTGSGSLSSNGVSINNTGDPPDPSAILDVSSSSMGILIPRLSTGERDLILPVAGLFIYNTSTNSIDYWNGTSWFSIATDVGAAGVITGTATVCQGQNGVAFSVGSITNATGYTWQYTGSGFSIASGSGTNSITANFSGAATSGNLTVYGTNACGDGATSASYPITVNVPPTTATNTSTQSICTTENATLSGNNPVVGTGTWTVVSGPSTSSSQFGNTTVYNTTFTPAGGAGNYVVRWTISNSPCTSSYADATITVNTCFACGSSFTDPRDGQSYNTVTIGTQCWFQKNLNYNQSSYGDDWCYNYDPGNCTTYGRLYNWAAVMQGAVSSNSVPSNVQGVCPAGWHIPSDAEWDILLNFLGGIWVAGGKMRETGTVHWISDPGVSNSSGFTAFGGGTYDGNTANFYEFQEGAYWWSCTQYNATSAYYRYINYNNFELARYSNPKYYGQSIRCLKD